MERFLALGLVGLNLPLYYVLFRLMFDGWHEFYSGILGDEGERFSDRWWRMLKAVVFRSACFGIVVGERWLIRWQYGF
jgi:hypothetical protein